MTGWLQAGAAVLLAFVLHVGAFALPSATGDLSTPEASGEGGDQTISLTAQDAAIAALVAEWDRPPVVTDVPDALPDALEEPPAVSAEVALPDMPTQPEMPKLPDMVTLVPVLDMPPTALPSPEAPKVAPVAQPKPDPAEVEKTPKKKPKPAEKAEKAPQEADSLAGQKAAGSGRGVAEGNSGKAEAAGVSKAKAAELKAAWGAKVRSRIERKKSYPKSAQGASGTVSVRLTVGRGGDLRGVSVTGSSGNAALDAAAVKAVKSAGKFPKAPKGLTEASYSFTLSMAFQK